MTSFIQKKAKHMCLLLLTVQMSLVIAMEAAYVPTTVQASNRSAVSVYVVPEMATVLTPSSQKIKGIGNAAIMQGSKPVSVLAAILPSNSIDVKFNYNQPVSRVYVLTPAAMAAFQNDNPTAPELDIATVLSWIKSKGKSTKDGVYFKTAPTQSATPLSKRSVIMSGSTLNPAANNARTFDSVIQSGAIPVIVNTGTSAAYPIAVN